MRSPLKPIPSLAPSYLSMWLMLVASFGCFVAWWVYGAASFLIASLGFLVLAPLWFRSPVYFTTFFGAKGDRPTPRHRMTKLDLLLVLLGYTFILAAIALGIWDWVNA